MLNGASVIPAFGRLVPAIFLAFQPRPHLEVLCTSLSTRPMACGYRVRPTHRLAAPECEQGVPVTVARR